MLSQKRSRLPCGADFPQTLLTCRRPVSPPTGRRLFGAAAPAAVSRAMPLRLATWNINSVRLRIDNVRRLIAEWAPDVLCLQETKTPDPLFPGEAVEGARLSAPAGTWDEGL